MKRLFCLWMLSIVLFPICPVHAEQAQTANYRLVYAREEVDTAPLTDDDAATLWQSNSVKSVKLRLHLASPCEALYIDSQNAEKTVRVYLPDKNGDMKKACEIKEDRLQFVLPLPQGASTDVQLEFSFPQNQRLTLSGLLAAPSAADLDGLPQWCQAATADVLLPLSGTALTDTERQAVAQATQSGATVQVVAVRKLTGADHAALLAALWQAGCDIAPVSLNFREPAKEPQNESALLRLWGQKKLDTQFAMLIRCYAPIRLLLPETNDVYGQTLVGSLERAKVMAADNGWVDEGLEQTLVWQPMETLCVKDGVSPLPTRTEAEQACADALRLACGVMPGTVHSAAEQLSALLGQPLSGCQLVQDEENGLWLYRTETLTVSILRNHCDKPRLTWYVADIAFDPTAEHFGCYAHNRTLSREQEVQPDLIAKENHLVFGMNSDYYQYRKYYKKPVGIILRDGELIIDDATKAKRRAFPPLDNFAFYPDGCMEVSEAQSRTADDFIQSGAWDVCSFGPILAQDGLLRAPVVSTRSAKEPRCGIGMVSPGHLVAVLVEGRMNDISEGCGIAQLGRLLYANGCVQAINIDGGHTAAMVFMGERITRVGNLSGRGLTSPRAMIELLGIGQDDRVN